MNKKKPTVTEEEFVEIIPEPFPEQKEPEPEPEPVNLVYIGPDIPKLVNHGTVFCGGIPAGLEVKIGEIPPLKCLLVPVETYAESEKALKVPGRLKTIYEHVVKHL